MASASRKPGFAFCQQTVVQGGTLDVIARDRDANVPAESIYDIRHGVEHRHGYAEAAARG